MSGHDEDLRSHYDNLEAWLRVEREANEIQNRNSKFTRSSKPKNQNLQIFEQQVKRKQKLLAKKKDDNTLTLAGHRIDLNKYMEGSPVGQAHENSQNLENSYSTNKLSEKSRSTINSIKSKYQAFKTEVIIVRNIFLYPKLLN